MKQLDKVNLLWYTIYMNEYKKDLLKIIDKGNLWQINNPDTVSEIIDIILSGSGDGKSKRIMELCDLGSKKTRQEALDMYGDWNI